MPRGDKSSYTGKQKRQAEHIEEGYEKRGVPEREAERRAWATVNKETHGGKKSGSGRGKAEDHSPVPQRRAPGRARRGEPAGRRPLALGQEGGRDPQAAHVALIRQYSRRRAAAHHARPNCLRNSSLARSNVLRLPADKFLPARLM